MDRYAPKGQQNVSAFNEVHLMSWLILVVKSFIGKTIHMCMAATPDLDLLSC